MLIDKILASKDDIDKLESSGDMGKLYTSSIKKAESFVIPLRVWEEVFYLTRGVESEEMVKYLKLPFPNTFLNVEVNTDAGAPMVIGFLLSQLEDGEVFMSVVMTVNKNSAPLVFETFYTILSTKNITMNNMPYNKSDSYDERIGLLSEHLTSTVLKMMYAINCQGLIEIEPKDFTKLNKSRQKKGKVPLKDYSIIKIKLTEQEKAERKAGGSHNSPRKHLRRGHFRHLPEKVVWVRNCVVGTGKKIKQSYVIS